MFLCDLIEQYQLFISTHSSNFSIRCKIRANNHRKILLFAVIIVILSLYKTIPTDDIYKHSTNCAIIEQYIIDNGLFIKKDADEYRNFMRGILLGEYPELAYIGSEYIHSQEEMNSVHACVMRELDTEPWYRRWVKWFSIGDDPNMDIQEVQPEHH